MEDVHDVEIELRRSALRPDPPAPVTTGKSTVDGGQGRVGCAYDRKSPGVGTRR
jgi:hypothetical protein